MPVCKFRYLEIESGIVDENHGIGSEPQDVLLAELYVAEEPGRMGEHFPEAHDSAFPVMAYKAFPMLF